MWSLYYKYYQIRKDSQRSEKIDTEYVKKIINDVGYFKSNGVLTYESNEGKPWMTLTLIYSEDGSYAINKTTSYENINLIEVITSRRPGTNEKWYSDIVIKLGHKLNREVVLEEDDAGNEEVAINTK